MTPKSSVIIIGAIVMTLLINSVSNVYAGGPRFDYPDPGTEEEANCWIDGYESGFGGKYDNERASDCYENGDDAYNESWDGACEDFPRTKEECTEIMNNPVQVEDYEELVNEIDVTCRNDGMEDGKADRPFNKDRDTGCDEFGDQYGDAYKSACQTDNTESTCDLIIEGERNYCPWHPDIVGCVEFLHNATNKAPEPVTLGACGVFGDPRPQFTCPQENNPEGYCLMTNHTAFCKTIGDLCDEGGFVRPEYPYCTQTD
jgi:hypothetical protein